ncbi:MAG: hypothetical protein KJO01_05520 [Gammaproteobacteria bacterium]|nr:hypothetical protein [Gammaproteobacteria bacterium]MBT8109298.1 hypothetical protein [Gammaproteobacteria bacterium]NND47771.1 hypothetical protein [Woeseiaceae bacterium]NNL44000.1 hypothetical protein [Woeseiaceae bacterium]
MDKLAQQLRNDAEKIEVTVSDQLDHRIAASLQNVTPENESYAAPRSHRPALFWWASSLTGIAAAVAVIVIVNTRQPVEPAAPTPSSIAAAVPVIDWKAETAMLAGPLQQELDALQSDIRRAEREVRDDIGL